jgi:hypothetical protein
MFAGCYDGARNLSVTCCLQASKCKQMQLRRRSGVADLDLQHVGLLLAPVVDLLDLGVHQHADDLGLRLQLLQLSLDRLQWGDDEKLQKRQLGIPYVTRYLCYMMPCRGRVLSYT